MKAILVRSPGGTDALQYEDIEKPGIEPTQVLVRNEAIGVNYIDTYHRSGLYPVPTPFILGVEGAGVVSEVGEDVTHVKEGDRVAYVTRPSITSGSYAEYSSIGANTVCPLPPGVETAEGATIMLQGLTALALVTKAYAVEQGDFVLIHAAAGGTGQLLTQLATHRGAFVIASVSTKEKGEIARSLGAKEVIISSDQDIVSEVMHVTSNKGVKAVYDGVGRATFKISMNCLQSLGWLISFGNASGKVDPLELSELGKKNIRLMRPQLYGFIETKEDFLDLSAQLMNLYLNGHFKVSVHETYPLDLASSAHTDIESRKTTGKLLLKP